MKAVKKIQLKEGGTQYFFRFLVGTDNAWAVFEIWGWALTTRALNFFPARLLGRVVEISCVSVARNENALTVGDGFDVKEVLNPSWWLRNAEMVFWSFDEVVELAKNAYTNTKGTVTDEAAVEWTTTGTPKPYKRYGLANERGDVLTVTIWGERSQQIHWKRGESLSIIQAQVRRFKAKNSSTERLSLAVEEDTIIKCVGWSELPTRLNQL